MARRKLRVLKKEKETSSVMGALRERLIKSKAGGKLIEWGLLKEAEKRAPEARMERQDPIIMAVKDRIKEARTKEEKECWKEIGRVLSQSPEEYAGGPKAWYQKQDDLFKRLEEIKKKQQERKR